MIYELITVIVPVYNVEKYLRRCIDSIRCQTYSNIEIILVDDGSTDCSGKICDEYVEIDKRIKVCHQNNMGLSAARNTGLKLAKGEYIGFIDSDDYIDGNMYGELLKAMMEMHADLAICGVEMVDEKGYSIKSVNLTNGVISKHEALSFVMESDGWPYVTAWNKLYKKSLFDSIEFPVGKYNEDMFIVCSLLHSCNSICVIDSQSYKYTQRTGSIMHGKANIKMMDGIEAYYLSYFYLKDHGYSDLLNKCSEQFFTVYKLRRRIYRCENSMERERIKQIDGMFRDVVKRSNKKCSRIVYMIPLMYSVKYRVLSLLKRFFNTKIINH